MQRLLTYASLAIYSLGDDLTYSLVKPILERCTPEQLIRFEQLSPVNTLS